MTLINFFEWIKKIHMQVLEIFKEYSSVYIHIRKCDPEKANGFVLIDCCKLMLEYSNTYCQSLFADFINKIIDADVPIRGSEWIRVYINIITNLLFEEELDCSIISLLDRIGEKVDKSRWNMNVIYQIDEFDDDNITDIIEKGAYIHLIECRYERIWGITYETDEAESDNNIHAGIINHLIDHRSNLEVIDYMIRQFTFPVPRSCIRRFAEYSVNVTIGDVITYNGFLIEMTPESQIEKKYREYRTVHITNFGEHTQESDEPVECIIDREINLRSMKRP